MVRLQMESDNLVEKAHAVGAFEGATALLIESEVGLPALC